MLHYVLEDLMLSMKPTKDIEPLKKGHGSICHKHELKGRCHELPHVDEGLVVHLQAHH
jgi:hypothetical protein